MKKFSRVIVLLLVISILLTENSFISMAAEINSQDTTEKVSAEDVKQEGILTWEEYCGLYIPEYKELIKEEKIEKYNEYNAYVAGMKQTTEGGFVGTASEGSFSNDYLTVVVSDTGQFTIGNEEGNPNYTSDNNRNLLYGYPYPGTSRTLLKIGSEEMIFNANSITYTNSSAIAFMTISEYGIQVIQTLTFCKSGNVDYEDSVRISYQVVNQGSASIQVGIRIMLDTMLASNDHAPFKITGTGNVTTIKNYTGSSIPSAYQVYDDLVNPTTIATGFLTKSGERTPDRVQFTNWGELSSDMWYYVGEEGGYLGDSAVGIYYDPTFVDSGKSISVATYYGVGVGTTMGSTGSISLSGTQLGVEIKDNSTNSTVQDATVTVTLENGTSVTGNTGTSGGVVLDDFPNLSVLSTITVTAEGYETRKVTQTVGGGSKVSICIKKNTDTSPIIESVKLDGKDVLNSNVHYIENSNKDIEDSSNVKAVTLKVTSDTENCIYYLVQDESVLQKNTTGEFAIKTVETKSGIVIDKFKSGGNRYVKCVSEDGKTSQKIKLGIKVSIPSVSTTNILETNLFPYGTTNIATGTIGALLLGDKLSFGSKNNPLKLSFEIEENGKFKVGLNLKKIPKSAAQEQKFFKAFSKMNFSDSFKEEFQDLTFPVSLGSVEPYVNVMGYGEGIIKDGAINVDLGIVIEGGVDASYTCNFYWVVPLYIKVGAGGKISVEVKANVHNDSGLQLALYSGTFAPEVYLSLEGGLGSKGIANIGVEGKGTLNYTQNWVSSQSKATLTGQANLIMAVWKFEKKLNLAKATVKIYDSNDEEGTVYGLDKANAFEALNAQTFTLKSRDYLTNSESHKGDFEAAEYTIPSQTVSAEAKPIIVTAGSKKYKFWLEEDLTRSEVSNDSVLVYSVYDDVNKVWKEATIVEDDKTADLDYNVAVDNGKIYIVWQDSNKEFDDDLVTVDTMAQAQEINFAMLDSASDTLSSTYAITDNSIMDAVPAITVSEGTAYLVWNAIKMNEEATEYSILSSEAVNYIDYIAFDQSATEQTIHEIACDSKSVAQITASVVGGIPTATYTLSDFTLSENEETLDTKQAVYTFALNNTTVTAGVALSGEEANYGQVVTGTLNGTNTLFWYQDNNIYYTTEIGNLTSRVFNEETSFNSSEFAIADAGNKTYVVWKGTETIVISPAEYDDEGVLVTEAETEEKRVIYATSYDGSSWSAPYKVVDVDVEVVRSLTADIDSADGSLLLSYLAINYDQEGNISSSEMVEHDIATREDVELTAVDYDEDAVAFGQALPLALTVTNRGNATLEQALVTIKGNYEEDYTKQVTGLNLAAGESTNITIDDFTVSDKIPANELCEYQIFVEASTVDEDATNGTYSIKVGYTSLLAENTENVNIGNEEYYQIRVFNNSEITAENVRIKVLADAQDGSIIYDDLVGTMEAGAEQYIYIASTDIQNSSQLYVYVTSDTPQDNESNAYTMLGNSSETVLVLTESTLTLEATEGGSVVSGVSGTYNSYDEIEIAAQPKAGYVFDGWVSTAGVFEDDGNISTIYTMPECAATVTARFVEKVITTNISLSNEALTLSVGDTATPAVITDPEANKNQVTWQSNNESVATVSHKGVITAVGAGIATITVTPNENTIDSINLLSASCEVTVSEVSVTAIRMVYPGVTLEGIGEQEALETVLNPGNATEDLLWDSDNEDVVSVDNGTVTAIALGSATITVSTNREDSEENISAVCNVSVTNPLNSISLSKTTLALAKGDETDITVSFNPEDTTDELSTVWTNHSQDVIEVSSSGDRQENLHIKALTAGTARIEANVNGKNAFCTVTVLVPSTAVGLTSSFTMTEGTNQYLNYSLTPTNSTDTVIWSSSNVDVVSVNNSGSVYAEGIGTAVITVQTSSGKTASCTITVVKKTYEAYETVNVISTAGFECLNPDNNLKKIWQYSAIGAASVQLTFSSDTEFESECDYLKVIDASDTVVDSYTGIDLAGKTITISGSLVRLLVTTDDSVTSKGFKVTGIKNIYNLNQATVSVATTADYTGSAITPEPVVKIDSTTLKKGEDYTVSYSNNINVGIATLTVNAISPNVGSKSVNYTINKLYNLNQATVLVASTAYYTGAAITPEPVVKFGSATLKKGEDYTVSYSNNINVGNATLTIHAVSPNLGSQSVNFTISLQSLSVVTGVKQKKTSTTGATLTWNNVSNATGYKVYRYNTKTKKYDLKKTLAGSSQNALKLTKLKADTSYKYAVTAYITNAGKTVESIKATITVKTSTKVPSSAKATAKKKSAKLNWGKVSGASGYEIYVSSKKSSGFKLVATVKKAATTSTTIKKLPSKKTRYIKIRTYVTTSSGKVYSNYSNVVLVKAK